MTKPTTKRIFGQSHEPDEGWLAKAVPETALEPQLPIVDAHLHSLHRGEYRYLLEEYAHDLAACGHNVVATVAAECRAMYRAYWPDHLKCVGETTFLVGIAAMAASGEYTAARVAASIVAFADLTLGDRTRETREAHKEAANGRLAGIRQAGKWDSDPAVRGAIGPGRAGFYLEPEFGKGLDVLAAMGLTFDASVFHTQIPDVVSLARAHPGANIVLIHTGSPMEQAGYAGKEAQVHATWLA
ncbi:amidohydrolase family protein [Rhodoferax sediminis]|uniref:Amidohydrolase-related domain-containing protein n=1 Tax=Rhodoferax sediminis TaxID=2509614 RepID=A0A515DE35_9BURK|nr:amidohydrolase family protein [Rhodoferax sediminis]QDL38657.1 hypothetical protein EUB48_16195 [Rhodoferax sediminis]